MAGTQAPFFNPQFFDYSGTRVFPAALYLLEQYIEGTDTDQDTFTDEDLTIPNTHPIVLDMAGKCTLWLDSTLLYTFVLKKPDGTMVDTWDVTPIQPQTSGDFVRLDGSVPMTGLQDLAGPGTSSLNPVTLQQMTDAIAGAISSITALTDAATAAAAAATAAAAAITPTIWTLASADGSAVTQDVPLTAGNWQITLLTNAEKDDSGGSYSSFNVTQAATVSTTTVNSSMTFVRAGGGGYGRNIGQTAMAVGTLTVATAGTVTMAISAASLGSASGKGSLLIAQKQP